MSFAFDYTTILYGPVYGSLGVPAVLTLDDTAGTTVNLTVIDKTDGLAVDSNAISVDTIKPVAMVRANELLTNGIAFADVDDALITFNSQTWRVESHRPMPSPGGEFDGQVMLILIMELPSTPPNGYTAEDGVTFYITEDGGSYYVRE